MSNSTYVVSSELLALSRRLQHASNKDLEQLLIQLALHHTRQTVGTIANYRPHVFSTTNIRDELNDKTTSVMSTPYYPSLITNSGLQPQKITWADHQLIWVPKKRDFHLADLRSHDL